MDEEVIIGNWRRGIAERRAQPRAQQIDLDQADTVRNVLLSLQPVRLSVLALRLVRWAKDLDDRDDPAFFRIGDFNVALFPHDAGQDRYYGSNNSCHSRA